MSRLALLSSFLLLLLAGCSLWRGGVPSEPQVESLPPAQEEPSPAPTEEPAENVGGEEGVKKEAEVATPQKEIRKEVSTADQKLLLGFNDWFAGIGEIEAAIRKWSFAAKRGEEIPPSDIVAIRKRYALLHVSKDSIAISPAHKEAKEVVEAYDKAARDALALVSDPPTAAELEQAVGIFRGLTEEANARNRILNEILY